MAKKSTLSKSAKEAITTLAIKQAGGAYEFWIVLLKETGCCKVIGEYSDKTGDYDIGFSKSKKPTNNYWKFTGNRSSKMGLGYIGGKFVVGKDKSGIIASSSLIGK